MKFRYKAPDGETSRLITTVVRNRPRPMSRNLGFASTVAEFGMLLTDSAHRGGASFGAVAARAATFRGPDPEGYRAEFVKLVDLAGRLHSVRRMDDRPAR